MEKGVAGQALPVGTLLETYELREVLGQGGGGISYRAFDRELEREVVLKEHFPLGLCRRDPATADVEPLDEMPYELSLQSFCRGARMLARMRHVGVVQIHEIFCACGTAFLVMDYVEGVALRAWASEKPSAARVQKLLEDLLSTLEYIHGVGVIHRDIKPANILVRANGCPVLIDFDTSMPGEPTHTPTLVGTPGYAAPEQFREGAVPGPQADIYALGRSLQRVAEECGMRLPRYISRTLTRACAEEPEKRYACAAEWMKSVKSARRRPWMIAAGALVVLVGAAGITWGLISGDSEADSSAGKKRNHHISSSLSTENGATDEAQAPVSLEYHPANLVRYNSYGDLIRGGNVELPPAAEELVSALLAAQREYNEACEANDALQGMDFNRMAYEGQKALNEKVIALINEYIEKNYGGTDPDSSSTEMLIAQVRRMRLEIYEGILSHHATHPIHLVAYDSNGFLKPEVLSATENEVRFKRTLETLQREYHSRLESATQEAAQSGMPLTEEQRLRLSQRLQRELNQKVLAVVEEYIATYIREDHPEFNQNEPLRQKIANWNLREVLPRKGK